MIAALLSEESRDGGVGERAGGVFQRQDRAGERCADPVPRPRLSWPATRCSTRRAPSSHRIFKLKEHIDRLYNSLRYIQVDPRISPKEMTAITEDVVARNLHLIDADDDYWVSQRISRGSDSADSVAGRGTTPTVIVECRPLPLKQRARLFRDGHRRDRAGDPPHRAGHAVAAGEDAQLSQPRHGRSRGQGRRSQAWAVLLDANGNLCEGYRQQHLHRAQRHGDDAARALRAAGHQPRDRHRAGARDRAALRRGRHRPLRRLHRRRGVPDLNLALHLPRSAASTAAMSASIPCPGR